MARVDPGKGAKQPNAKQKATFNDLTQREGYISHRMGWDGKSLLLGVTFEPAEPGGAVRTRMYRIDTEGKAVGV